MLPDWRTREVAHGTKSPVTPTRASRTFTLRMSYDGRDRTPSVTVLRPKLRSDDVRRLPHVYLVERLTSVWPGTFCS
jgi:hypothetical protein